jgi:hypothetical protein
MTPSVPGKRALGTQFAHCPHIVFIIGKYTDCFFLGGGIFRWENFHWLGKFLCGGNFEAEVLHGGEDFMAWFEKFFEIKK